MILDSVPIVALFVGAILIVMLPMEGGYRLGRMEHRRSKQEKESPVSAIAGAVLALLAFILAFTFGIASNRLDARKTRSGPPGCKATFCRNQTAPRPRGFSETI
jgi:NADH:ubiquinone oxidoreductase subunit 6 (subunit J)